MQQETMEQKRNHVGGVRYVYRYMDNITRSWPAVVHGNGSGICIDVAICRTYSTTTRKAGCQGESQNSATSVVEISRLLWQALAYSIGIAY